MDNQLQRLISRIALINTQICCLRKDLDATTASSANAQTLNGNNGSYYLSRSNHTGTQAANTITGLSTVATSGNYTDLSNKPTFATVATSGSYTDLSNKPTIPTLTSALTNDSGFITTSSAGSTYFPLIGGTITGTAGAGYLGLIPQSTNPSTPTSGVVIYSRSSGAFSWKGTNGFQRTFLGTGLTADRDYTLPDATGTLLLNDNTATLTGKSIAGDTNTLTNIPLTTAVTGTLPIGNGGTGNTSFTSGRLNYYNGTSFVSSTLQWDSTNNRIGINTSPTHAITLPSGSAIALYNTADQTTNTEKITLINTSNQFQLASFITGTGTARSLVLGVCSSNSLTTLNNTSSRNFIIGSSTPFFVFNHGTTALAGSNTVQVNGAFTNTSGTSVGLNIGMTYTQTSAGASSDLVINRTETGIGSGSHKFIDAQVGGSSKFNVSNAGKISLDATITATGTTTAQTINKPSGSVNVAASATSVTVTNSIVTANSIIIPVRMTAGTGAVLDAVVVSAGSFTINFTTAPSTECKVGFIVFN